MKRTLLSAFIATAWFSLLLGIVYPLTVTGLAQVMFPSQARGSLIKRKGLVIGSVLIAQQFKLPEYFWPRPSAVDYNAAGSGGSNFGPSSNKLLNSVQARLEFLRETNPDARSPAPEVLVTASASGLDPDLPPAAALWQVPRIAKVRGLSQMQLAALVRSLTQRRTFGLLGEPRVNVLQLNLALDTLRHPSVASHNRGSGF